jgi:hypothetical protein
MLLLLLLLLRLLRVLRLLRLLRLRRRSIEVNTEHSKPSRSHLRILLREGLSRSLAGRVVLPGAMPLLRGLLHVGEQAKIELKI